MDVGGAAAVLRTIEVSGERGIAVDADRSTMALCGLDMAMLLGPAEPHVRAAAVAARETFVRLRAAPFIKRLDLALQERPSASATRASRSRDLSNV